MTEVSSANPNPLIRVENASVRLGGQEILPPLSLSIKVGERIAILGPNGAGKSTLVKLLSGEHHPFAGQGAVLFGGNAKAGLRNLRKGIVAVSSDLESKVLHDPSVRQLVQSGRVGSLGILQNAGLSEADEDAVAKAIDEMGLSALAERTLSSLSSGERRRSWIARALSTEPAALILDEPTANLDFGARQILHAKLEKLARKDLSILLVTHHLEDVTPLFGRVILMQSGRIVFDGNRQAGIEYLESPPQFQMGNNQGSSVLLNSPNPSPEEYLAAMRCAPVYNVAVESPLEEAKLLGSRLGCRVLLKREDLQETFSFKIRGSYVKMANLLDQQRAKGVIAASAGNHAQGVALAGQRLGIKTSIVVPATTPTVKTEAILKLGADLELFGDTYDEAYSRAKERAEKEDLVFVHPYDDPEVIAGQGTIGLEIDRQYPQPIDAVFVAVGGGGLISGIALALKQIRPGIKIIGVEPEDSDALHKSLIAGNRIQLDRVGLLADGVAVKQVGVETFRIASQFVDETIVVSNDQICAAVRDIFEDRRVVLEPSGALAFAGLKKYVELGTHRDKTYLAIACGANLTFERLQYVAERSLVGERREAILAVKIPESAGSFRQFCQTIGPRMVTEFNYRMSDSRWAMVFVGLGVKNDQERQDVVAELRGHGYETLDLTEDDLAAIHLRHMVGGKSPHPKSEKLFHFDFPERRGALLEFLDRLGGKWNISMFHYRNHGADRGRVLIGFEVDPETEADFQRFLGSVEYPSIEVTLNPGLAAFLL